MPESNFHPYSGVTPELQISNWMPMLPDPNYASDNSFSGACFGKGQLPWIVGNYNRYLFYVVGSSAEIQYCQEGRYNFHRVTAAEQFADNFNDAEFIPLDLGDGKMGRYVFVGDHGEIQTVDIDAPSAPIQRRTGVTGKAISNIEYLDGQLVAVGFETILLSPNGADWTDVTPSLSEMQLYSVCSGDGPFGRRLVATGHYSSDPFIPLILYSDDAGATWNQATIDPVAVAQGLMGFYGAQFYKDRFLAAEIFSALPGTQYTTEIEASATGDSFERITTNILLNQGRSDDIYQFEVFKGLLVTNQITNVYITSDGENYKGPAGPFLSIPSPISGRFFGDKGLAIGEQGCIVAGSVEDVGSPAHMPAIWSSMIVPVAG